MTDKADQVPAPITSMLLELRTRALAGIERLQDFQAFTGHSYDRYAKMAEQGQLVESVSNVRTQTTLESKDLASILMNYLDKDLPRIALYQLVSEFEAFFFDFLKLLFQHNPRALAQGRQLTVADVLAHCDRLSLISHLIDNELHGLSYKSVPEWFEYLDKIVRLGVSARDIERLAELKATRDIAAHNAGIANEVYVRKAGSLARARANEALSMSRPYVYDSADFVKGLVRALVDAACARLSS
jgi:hypothetical protein